MTGRGDWMQTYTGRTFYPLDPRPEDIDARDIGHALSMIIRFGGHCRRFYSVAEHSLIIADHVPESDALWALLHDASEAYVNDLVRPLKYALPAYRRIESKVMIAIRKHFRLPAKPDSIKQVENRLLLTERQQLMAPPPKPWFVDDLEPLPVNIQCLDPATAKQAYLSRLATLIREDQ